MDAREKLIARDLRIGNIIHDPHKGADGYTYVTSRTIHAMDSHPCDFQPIPLSEEWLARLGFINNNNSIHYYCGRFHMAFDNNRFWFMGVNYQVGGIELKYVHQLQNLYHALTQTELTTNELTGDESITT